MLYDRKRCKPQAYPLLEEALTYAREGECLYREAFLIEDYCEDPSKMIDYLEKTVCIYENLSMTLDTILCYYQADQYGCDGFTFTYLVDAYTTSKLIIGLAKAVMELDFCCNVSDHVTFVESMRSLLNLADKTLVDIQLTEDNLKQGSKSSHCNYPPCHGHEHGLHCSKVFKGQLREAVCRGDQITNIIEKLYKEDIPGETKPFDPSLYMLAQEELVKLGLDLLELEESYVEGDFLCGDVLVQKRLTNATTAVYAIEIFLDYIDELKKTDDERLLCLAELTFTDLMREVDLLESDLYYVKLVYLCDDVCY